MPALANPKWEKFARLRAEGKNIEEAYGGAGYKNSQLRKGGTWNGWRSGSSLMAKRPEVKARIAELLESLARKTEITLERATEMLIEDRQLAYDLKQASAAVSASCSIAKLHGLMVERTMNLNVYATMTNEQLGDELARIRSQIAEIEVGRSGGLDGVPPAV
ncbi:MAG: hypothetical protein L0Y60_04210 [Beijerinckiaceae bacterium]|nr:hypothetical protein [Beijerinckiaceae bacterium]